MTGCYSIHRCKKIGEEKVGMYYCLRCGSRKEIINKYLVVSDM